MSSTNVSLWFALILGILIGWLAGWCVDSWFDRRRAHNSRKLTEGTATLPDADVPVSAFAAGAGTDGVAVQDGLAVTAGDGEPADTPAVEEEPLPMMRYAQLILGPESRVAQVQAGEATAIDLPGVEQEDLPVRHPLDEEVIPASPGELTGADEL